MVKTHIILVGFGDVGTKIFPTLMQINNDGTSATGSLDISIVDTFSWNEMIAKVKPKLKARFEGYSEIEYDEKLHLEFLEKNYFQDDDPDGYLIPEGLIKRIRLEKTIIYLALNPDKYYGVLEKYLPFGNIFAIEKPLAKDSCNATALVHYAKQYEQFLGKRFIPVDHYLGKYAVNLFDQISKTHKFSTIIEDSNLIIFSFLEKKISPPLKNSYFTSTGIIADMMPHVSALLKKILNTKFIMETKNVRSSVLDSYKKACIEAHFSPVETYAEIELVLSEENRPPRTVVVRIGKGMPFEERTVTFVDSVGDILSMKMPHPELKEGEVLLKDKDLWIKVDYEKPAPKKWDNSYYNIILGLMDNKSSLFLTMEDAQEIVEITKEIRNAIDTKYLFRWDEIPGNDNKRLLEFLEPVYGIAWVKKAKVKKMDNPEEIDVTAGKNLLSLKLNNEKTKINVEIEGNRIDELIAKMDDSRLKIYKMDEYHCYDVPKYLAFDWINYNWESKTDYAVIFNFNGVLIENRDINMGVWKWVLDQLRIKDYDEGDLSELISSGLLTKEILLSMLIKYSKRKIEVSTLEILSSNWAKVKEQQYISDIIRKNAKDMEGAKELIQALTNRQIKIGLYSIFPRHSLIQILHRIGIKQFFDVVVTPDLIRSEYKNQNPIMGCLNEVAARIDIEKEKCFLLDDSAICVEMATDMGVKCIGFGMENRQELINRGAICVVNDHTTLLDIFNNSQNLNEIVDKLKRI